MEGVGGVAIEGWAYHQHHQQGQDSAQVVGQEPDVRVAATAVAPGKHGSW